MTTKKRTKKFQLVSKYANYPTWDEKQNAPDKNLIFLNFWCGQRDLNSHGLSPHGPQPCLSTNFSMTAFMRQNKLMTIQFQVGKFLYGS